MTLESKKNNCTCNSHKRLTANGVIQGDPTHTLTLRRAFVRAMERRFTKLQKDIEESIVDNDAFGFSLGTQRLAFQKAAEPFDFAVGTTADKIDGFMTWLREQEQAYILSGGVRGLQIIQRPGTGGINVAWTDTYIQSAYQKGILRARTELRKAGRDIPTEPTRIAGGLNAVFNQPIHVDRLAVLYTRTFEDLKTVTEAMNSQVRRELAEGLTSGLAQGISEGKSPRVIARELTKKLNDRVEKIGKVRARQIARTEIIRAHHVATIQEYKRYGVAGVEILAEWVTAGFEVCKRCQAMEGKIFTLEEIEPLIPLHPS